MKYIEESTRGAQSNTKEKKKQKKQNKKNYPILTQNRQSIGQTFQSSHKTSKLLLLYKPNQPQQRDLIQEITKEISK